MRYYVANSDNIPLHAQPENGYTKLQVITRVQLEIDHMCSLFGGCFSDYKDDFHILDSNFKEVHEFDNAI